MNSTQSTLSGKSKYLLSLAILGVASGLCVILVLFKEPPPNREDANLTPTVSVFPASVFDGRLSIEVSGVVEPHREVTVSAQVSGEISEKSPDAVAGNFVRQGDLLMAIDPQDYELEIDRLNAELEQSKAAINELNDELEGLERSREIVQRDYNLQLQELERRRSAKSALSQSELDQAARSVMAAERTLTELQNSIRQATTRRVRLTSGITLSESMLNKARLNLQRTGIRAPFDGVIVNDPVEQGDYVRTGDTLLVFEDTSKADVKCNLRGNQVLQILKYSVPDSRFETDPLTAAYQLPPTPVRIFARSGEDTIQWDGTLQRFDGIGFDEQTKMIPVRVVVDDPVSNSLGRPVALVRQMFVNVVIGLDTANMGDERLLVIPEIAIHPGNHVWSVKDGRLQRHNVSVLDRLNPGAREQDRLVVIRTAGGELQAGSQIVVTPLAQPNPGTEVDVLPLTPELTPAPLNTTKTGTDAVEKRGEPLTTSPGDVEEPANTGVAGAKRS